jgi:hypothetical protein
VEGHPEIFTKDNPKNIAMALVDKLELLEAKNPPQIDTLLASFSGIDTNGLVVIPAREAAVRAGAVLGVPQINTIDIVDQPERAFRDLVRQWLESKERDTPQ